MPIAVADTTKSDSAKYKISGEFKSQGNNKLLLFELEEPVVTKTVEHIAVPDEVGDEAIHEEIVVREKVCIKPISWTISFGVPAAYLERRHYYGEWEVLRPARELEEMNTFTAEGLDSLMKEAEIIMEGWKKTA